MEASSPIILSMDVHCRPCARIITRCLIGTFSLDRVVASHRMDKVLVYGGASLDPSELRRFLQQLGKERHRSHGGGASPRRVIVLSDGGRPVEGMGPMASTPPTYTLLPFHAYPPPPPPPYSRYSAGPKSRWLSRYCPRQSIIKL